MSRGLRILFVLVGVGLLAFVVWSTDLAEVGRRLGQIGLAGVALVLGLYFLAFLCDTAAWQMTFIGRAPTLAWLYRLWEVRLIGEAVNNSTPLGSVGGEPVKAMLLRKYHGIGLREGVTTLVSTKTCLMIALVLFLAAGFSLMLTSDSLTLPFKVVAGAGLAGFAAGIALLVVFQRFQLATHAGGWVARGSYGARFSRWLDAIYDMDRQLLVFYTGHIGRFAAAIGFGFANWVLGVVELMLVLALLGHPIAMSQAYIVEAMAQLVRAGTFFIPMSLGATEGTFILVVGAMTGVPPLGLAVSLVRRGRELVWMLLGFAMFWAFSGRPPHPDAPESV